jgi:hypothetical protein
MKNATRFCPLVALSLAALPAAAHHSPAQFDLDQDAILEGTIRDVSWRNPHVYFELEVVEPSGRHATRRIEAGGASNMAALGLDASALAIGERVVVEVKPNRRGGDLTALGWSLTKADGTAIPLHVRAMPPSAPSDAEASSLVGTWVPQAAGFAALAAAARTWPLTEAGRAAVDATREARDASRSECVPFGPPALMLLPSAVIVEQRADALIFRLDVMGAERVVHLGESAHPARLEPSLHGHSIGRWDGETLVVDTVGFAAHPDGYGFDLPSSAAKHIVERFTLAADRKRIVYEALVDDAEYLAAPVTHRAEWDYRPQQSPSNLPCDIEAAARFTLDD